MLYCTILIAEFIHWLVSTNSVMSQRCKFCKTFGGRKTAGAKGSIWMIESNMLENHPLSPHELFHWDLFPNTLTNGNLHISSESSKRSLCVTYILKDLASFARSQKGTHWDCATILSLVMPTATPPAPIKLHVLPLKWSRRDHRRFRAWQSGAFNGIHNVFQIEGTVLYCTSSVVI